MIKELRIDLETFKVKKSSMFRFFLFYMLLLIPLCGQSVLWQKDGKIAPVIFLGKYEIKEPYILKKSNSNIHYIVDKSSIDFSDIKSTFLRKTCFCILTPDYCNQDEIIFGMSAELTKHLLNDLRYSVEDYDYELYKKIDGVEIYKINNEVDEFLIFLVSIAAFNSINNSADEFWVSNRSKPFKKPELKIKSTMPNSDYVLFAMGLKYDNVVGNENNENLIPDSNNKEADKGIEPESSVKNTEE